MESSKPTKPWMGDASSIPMDQLTIVDIIGVETNSSPGDSANSIAITLGNATTGEVYTTNAMLFNASGITSVPVAGGSYDQYGNFSPSMTSQTGAQAICYVRNDQWIVLSIRDVRTQNVPGNAEPGDAVMYAQGGQSAVVCKAADNSVVMTTTTSNDASGYNTSLTLSPQGLYFTSPFGSLSFDEGGFRVSMSNGASMALSGSANITTGNQFTVSAGSTTISSGIITLGNPVNTAIPLGAVYGVIPPVAPGIPILGTGIGAVVVQACASTTVFIGV